MTYAREPMPNGVASRPFLRLVGSASEPSAITEYGRPISVIVEPPKSVITAVREAKTGRFYIRYCFRDMDGSKLSKANLS
jgi:hypothetical protein